MIVSELIEKLKSMERLYGDVSVYIRDGRIIDDSLLYEISGLKYIDSDSDTGIIVE